MSERFRLDGRVALVTGAGSERGIGREIACVMRLAGARVALADLDGAGAHRNASELGDGAAAIQVEVTDPASVAAAVETVHERGSTTRRTSSRILRRRCLCTDQYH